MDSSNNSFWPVIMPWWMKLGKRYFAHGSTATRVEVTWGLLPTTPVSAPVPRTAPVIMEAQRRVVAPVATQVVERVVEHPVGVAIRQISEDWRNLLFLQYLKMVKNQSRKSIIMGDIFCLYDTIFKILYYFSCDKDCKNGGNSLHAAN